jgi:hypothetical protein
MNVQKLETLPPPPTVFSSLRTGFDVVSNHVVLILTPLAVDLFLWLGPRLSVGGLLSPIFKFMFQQARLQIAASDASQYLEMQTLFMEGLQKYNLLSLLTKIQIFPVGISSLSAERMSVGTPFGAQPVVQVSSALELLVLSFFLVLIGWVGGGLYYRLVSGASLREGDTEISSIRAIVQTLLLSAVWGICLMVLFVPLTIGLSLLALISPLFASGALMFIVILFIVPFFFAPHGIFVRNQNAIYSMFTSFRMTRFTLPTSGMFVLSVFLLSRGLNYLWSVPSNASWLTLVGLAGHAFITTALLSASFVYYREMNDWLQNVYERFQQAKQSVLMQK